MSQYIKVTNNIIICPNQPAEFIQAVQEATVTLASGPTGKRLLDKISKSSHVVWIKLGSLSETTFYDALGAVTKGKGSDAEIRLSQTALAVIDIYGNETESTFFLDFAHELIHAKHGFDGKNLTMGMVADKQMWHDDEEYQTEYGIPSKKDKQRTQPKITENAIRQEHHFPPIYTHLYAQELKNPESAREIKLQSLAHRSAQAMQTFLADPAFLNNPNKLAYIQPPDEETFLNIAKREGIEVVGVKQRNPHCSPPVLGKLYHVTTKVQPLKINDSDKEIHATAHRSTQAMQTFLADPTFLKNLNKLAYIQSSGEDDLLLKVAKKEGIEVIAIKPNPHSSSIPGKIHHVTKEQLQNLWQKPHKDQ